MSENNEKVKIPKKVADAIECVWSEQDNKEYVCKHLYLNNWSLLSDSFGRESEEYEALSDYAQKNPVLYMRALVEGYEIEKQEYVVDVTLQDGTFLKGINSLTAEDINSLDTYCDMTNLNAITHILDSNDYTVFFKTYCLESSFYSHDVIKYDYRLE